MIVKKEGQFKARDGKIDKINQDDQRAVGY